MDGERPLVSPALRGHPVPNPKPDLLWDEVYAAPDDDGPRERLAAHLSTQGDPRGELISP